MLFSLLPDDGINSSNFDNVEEGVSRPFVDHLFGYIVMENLVSLEGFNICIDVI